MRFLQLSKLGLIDNLQIYNVVVVLHGAYFAYSGHRTRTGLPIPYVLQVTRVLVKLLVEYSSNKLDLLG